MTSQSTIGNPDLAQILAKATDAANGGVGGLSTGEALVAALVLNRPDWLAKMDYTIAEALERIGPDWARLIPAAADKARLDKLEEFSARRAAGEEEVDFSGTLITSAISPGYRNVSLVFDLKTVGTGPRATLRAAIRVNPRDVQSIVHEIIAAHRMAWAGRRPIDVGPEEERPAWIGTP